MPQTDKPDMKLFVDFKPHKEKKLPNGKPSKPLQTIEITNGHYHRKFDAKDAPFEVADAAELQMLVNTGHFVEHKVQDEEKEVAKAAKKSQPKESSNSETEV